MPKKSLHPWIGYSLIVLVGITLLTAAGFVALIWMLGHKFYVVSGRAHIPADAVSHVSLPALVCSGHGGPLDSSAVYGDPIRDDFGSPSVAFCRRPEQGQTLEYRESLYYGSKPRRMHVYVWLETHEELSHACEDAPTALITVNRDQLRGERCHHKPEPTGSLGYAVAFTSFWGAD